MNWQKQLETAAVQPPNSFAPNRFEYIYTQLFVAANIRHTYTWCREHTYIARASLKSASNFPSDSCLIHINPNVCCWLFFSLRTSNSIFSICETFLIVIVVVGGIVAVAVVVDVSLRNAWLVLHVNVLEKGITHYYALEKFSN